MRYSHLLTIKEAIDVSEIDVSARRALQDDLLKHLEKEWDQFSAKHPNDDRSVTYDGFYRHWLSAEPVGGPHTISHEWAFSRRILDRASLCLTKLVQSHLRAKHGEEVIIAGNRVPVGLFKVKVEDRSDSVDSHKHAGGYFHPTDTAPLIKVFVDRDAVVSSGMALVQSIAFGEGEGYEELANLVGSVFAHEYVHLEQFLRGGFGHQGDYGYITKGGKRGNRRTPHQGENASEKLISWLRYKGSSAEIEAFAQQAASEMVAEVRRRSRNGESSNQDIGYLLTDIALGYGHGSAMSSYSAIGWSDYREAADEAGINPTEMVKTWRRFLKLVYRAVSNYRPKRTRRARYDHSVPSEWKDAARENSFGETARILAMDIAETAARERSWKRSGEEEFRYNESLTKAVMFLYETFFGKDFYEDEHRFDAMSAAFKRMVIRLYDKIDLSNTE